MKKFQMQRFVLASVLSFLVASFTLVPSARAELYVGALAGPGKDSSSDKTALVYGLNAGTVVLDTLRLGVYYQTVKLTQAGALGGVMSRKLHLVGLDVGFYVPVILDGLYGGVKLGLVNKEKAVANGLTSPNETSAVLGFTVGYDYKILPIFSVGLEGNAMGAGDVMYSLLATAKLWI